MSRIGKLPIPIPGEVSVKILDDAVLVKGPKGELTIPIQSNVSLKIEDGHVIVSRKDEEHLSRAQHGLMRSLVANMVRGVSEGFSKTLEIHGVGYRASLNGDVLKLNLGFSHEIEYRVPDGVEVKVDGNRMVVDGFDKQQVGQVAAQIRAFKKPEPYKGKGIRYSDEYIIRKAGKASATSGGA